MNCSWRPDNQKATDYQKSNRHPRQSAIRLNWRAAQERPSRYPKTAAVKRKLNSPWGLIRWTYLAKWVYARICWRRKWAKRERLAYLQQFDPRDIYYFAEDGLEHWGEL